MGLRSLFAARPGSRTIMLALVVLALFAFAVPFIGATELKLPRGMTEAQAKRIYSEQVASADSLEQLVSGEVGTIQVTGRRVGPKDADLNVKITFKDASSSAWGGSSTARVKVVKIGGKWYFQSITATGRSGGDGPLVANPDLGVLNTMLKEQSTHATATAGLVNGTFSRVGIGTPVSGYRSVVLPVTFSGKQTAKGEITCVKRTESGRDQWFLVSFAQ